MATIAHIENLEKTSSTFRAGLVQIMHELRIATPDAGLDPHIVDADFEPQDALAAVIAYETAGTYSPTIENPKSGAVGLIQWMPATAKEDGTTTYDLKQMTAEQQLEIVRQHYSRYNGLTLRFVDFYLAVFAPAHVGANVDRALYQKPSPSYYPNKGFDKNNDGIISAREAGEEVAKLLRDALQRPRLDVNMEDYVRQTYTPKRHMGGDPYWAKRVSVGLAVIAGSVVTAHLARKL